MSRERYREYIDRMLDRADDETLGEIYIFIRSYMKEETSEHKD